MTRLTVCGISVLPFILMLLGKCHFIMTPLFVDISFQIIHSYHCLIYFKELINKWPGDMNNALNSFLAQDISHEKDEGVDQERKKKKLNEKV